MEKMKQIKISEFNHTLLKTIAASEGRQIQDVVGDILAESINVQYLGDTGVRTKKEDYENKLKQRSRIKELVELRKEREGDNNG